MATLQDMIDAVRLHAQLNYEKDGWDYVVECWSDAEISEEISGCKTEKGAIRKIKSIVSPLAEYRDDIAATGEW